MTVRELIAELQTTDPDAVVIKSDSEFGAFFLQGVYEADDFHRHVEGLTWDAPVTVVTGSAIVLR